MEIAIQDSISQIQDYIVAEGDSGIWHYCKYANGWAVCSGVAPYTNVNINVTYYSLYDCSSKYVNYPFEFVTLPTLSITTHSTDGSAILGVETGANASTTRTPNFYFVRPDPATGLSVNANIIAIGKWK